MTIARHFNAGSNPQTSKSRQGRPRFAERNGWHGRNHAPAVQPSRWDWWPCASTPALKRRAIFGLSLLGRQTVCKWRLSAKTFDTNSTD